MSHQVDNATGDKLNEGVSTPVGIASVEGVHASFSPEDEEAFGRGADSEGSCDEGSSP